MRRVLSAAFKAIDLHKRRWEMGPLPKLMIICGAVCRSECVSCNAYMNLFDCFCVYVE